MSRITLGKAKTLFERPVCVPSLFVVRFFMDNPDHSQVCAGCKVKILLEDGSEREYVIGSSREASPQNGVISDACPIGKALIGAHRGDMVNYTVGERNFTVKVLDFGRK